MTRRRDQRSPQALAYRKWYSTKEWKRRRKQQLRIEPYCRMCAKQEKKVAGTRVDHVYPHRGDWEKFIHGPLQSLCETHHNSAKQSEERLGYSKEIGEDGWPSDPRHPFHAQR